MSIPSNINTAVHSLLFIDTSDTSRDTLIQECYYRVLRELTQKHAWFYGTESINSVTDQSLYSVDVNSVFTSAIYYNGTALRKITAIPFDLVNEGWQAAAVAGNGTPEFWWNDKVPPILDAIGGTNVTPEHFVLYPTPSTNGVTILVQGNYYPGTDDPANAWVDPLLIYRTTARFLRESTEERESDTPNEEVSLGVAKFFDLVADMWEKLLEKVL